MVESGVVRGNIALVSRCRVVPTVAVWEGVGESEDGTGVSDS